MLLELLTKDGAKDVKTQYVSLSPQYNEKSEAQGFVATNTVSTTIKELAKAGAVIDAAVNAGANQVYGPSLSHGDQDDLIPPQALFLAAQGLAAVGVPVEWHLSQGIGHGIDGEGLRHGGEFLARRFGLLLLCCRWRLQLSGRPGGSACHRPCCWSARAAARADRPTQHSGTLAGCGVLRLLATAAVLHGLLHRPG